MCAFFVVYTVIIKGVVLFVNNFLHLFLISVQDLRSLLARTNQEQNLDYCVLDCNQWQLCELLLRCQSTKCPSASDPNHVNTR